MKKYLFIAAMLLASGIIFAFKSGDKPTKAEPKVVAQQWYDFTGGDETNPINYILRNPQTTPSCTTGADMCAVKAEPHATLSGRPNLADPSKLVKREN